MVAIVTSWSTVVEAVVIMSPRDLPGTNGGKYGLFWLVGRKIDSVVRVINCVMLGNLDCRCVFSADVAFSM